MPGLSVHLEGDGCWPDLKDLRFSQGAIVGVARLPAGMTSGASSVCFRVELADGQVILAETSMKLFLIAARAFEAADARDAASAAPGRAH